MKKNNRSISTVRELQKEGDIECAHLAADDILCEILEKLGYSNITLQYYKIDKWYA